MNDLMAPQEPGDVNPVHLWAIDAHLLSLSNVRYHLFGFVDIEG